MASKFKENTKKIGNPKFLGKKNLFNFGKNKYIAVIFKFFLLIVLLTLYVLYESYLNGWNSYTASDEIFSNMFLNGSSLIFGTSDAHLHVVNTKNAQDVKDFDLNLGTVVPVKVEGKNVYAIANDSFWKINYVKKKVNWVFKTDDFYQVEHAEIVGTKLFYCLKVVRYMSLAKIVENFCGLYYLIRYKIIHK
jgi:hypothetical protein